MLTIEERLVIHKLLLENYVLQLHILLVIEETAENSAGYNFLKDKLEKKIGETEVLIEKYKELLDIKRNAIILHQDIDLNKEDS